MFMFEPYKGISRIISTSVAALRRCQELVAEMIKLAQGWFDVSRNTTN